VSLDIAVSANDHLFPYVAEAAHKSSITDSSVVSYDNIIPDYDVLSEVYILADYHALA